MTDMGGMEAWLVRLFDNPQVLGIALLLALGVGALHALAPGHGKTIAAAYLIGDNARFRDAALLGIVVAAMHTVSVAVLAIAWTALSVSGTGQGTAATTAWMQVGAAVGIVAVGACMVGQRLRRKGGHDHAHHHHSHALAHSHHDSGPTTARRPQRDHGHGSATSPRARPSRNMLLALGMSGGLLPSPSAFLVVVSGILTGRLLFAGALVAAFGFGMAATLAAVGVLTLRGRDLVARRSDERKLLRVVHRSVPVIGAVGVLLGGLVYLAVALSSVMTV